MALWLGNCSIANALTFTAGDIVVSVEGNGGNSASASTSATGNTGANANTYLDNQAAPLTLYEYTTTGGLVGTQMLPTTSSGNNSAIAGEYGSSSEGSLHLSGDGRYLTIAGYAVNPATYNSTYDVNGTGTALAQSCSLSSGCGGTPQVARVIATIGSNGQVDTSTVVNNAAFIPRTANISGQGTGNAGDTTGGVFYVPGVGPNQTPVPIPGADATSSKKIVVPDVGQDTRDVQIYNNTLYVSADTKEGKNSARDFIGTLGSPPATSAYDSGNGPTQLNGFGTSHTGKMTITTGANSNGNGLNAGQDINLSPADFFFANPTTLYVADTGNPKNDSNGGTNSTGTANIGNGGLQKWSLVSGTWTLDYTLFAGLNLVDNGSTDGVSGLLGLTGKVVGDQVELFATSYVLADTDQTYLYAILDTLSYTTASEASGELFTTLAAAPTDITFKGVAFAPVGTTPLSASWIFMLIGLAGFGVVGVRSRARAPGWAAA